MTFSPELEAGPPRLLFEGSFIDIPGFNHAMSPDGGRFLALESTAHVEARTKLTVITNFFDELSRRLPAESK